MAGVMRFFLMLCALVAVGCLAPHGTTVVDVPVHNWQEAAEIELPNEDTLTLRDLHLVVRYNDRFTGDSLRLAVRTEAPDSTWVEEWVTLSLPPLQRSAALHEERAVRYRERVVFPQQGLYRMRFTPEHAVCGVEAVGVDIESSESE